ncbi:hypothetical protein B0H14DRAFT_2605726 [Mycena olivaceomarginata]|nr:hypothetical protein B0H14DRAFT_2605726 [Mycena olivaceomarginata]
MRREFSSSPNSSRGAALPHCRTRRSKVLKGSQLPAQYSTTPVRQKYQIRLANSVHAIFAADPVAGLQKAIINCWCWDLYAAGPETGKKYSETRGWHWLEASEARMKIKHAFAKYGGTLKPTTDSPDIVVRVENILQGLIYWHGEDDAMQPGPIIKAKDRPIVGHKSV